MRQFEPILGRWKVEADFDLDPPMHMESEAVHEWLALALWSQ
jgi:hypothetical protein